MDDDDDDTKRLSEHESSFLSFFFFKNISFWPMLMMLIYWGEAYIRYRKTQKL